jgi:branched-chain amino acid aminotransferase
MQATTVFLNGRIVPADQAAISVFDAGLLHGASTFTTMLAHHGKVFRLDRHLGRLLETVAMLGLRTEATESSLREAVAQVLAASGLPSLRMRITLTPGAGEAVGATMLVTAEPLPDYPAAWYEKGVLVVVSSFKQAGGDPTFGTKTGCYLPRVLARSEAAAKGAEEALWFTADNRLAEGCFTNVFLVLDSVVHTPPRDTPVLPGVVREVVGELCGSLGLAADFETPLTVKEMLAAQEVFLTGSTTGIRPVAQIEKHLVGEAAPGPITHRLMAAYRELLDTECPA